MKGSFCVAALALAACSGGNSADENTTEPVALVKLAKAEPAQVQATTRLYGTAEAGAAGSAILSAPEEAIVATIASPAGSAVSRGQLVVQWAPRPTARLDVAKAASDARAAQQAYARAQRLRADGLMSNADVETARAAAQSADATRASLAARTGALDLRAPFAGHVQTISTSLGSLVPGGTAVATIMGAGDLRARFGVDPTLVRQIRPGAPLRVAPSAGGSGFTTQILSVDPTVDPQTRLASLFVRIPAAASIGAGEPLTAELLLPSGGNAPAIPYGALLDDAGQAYVFVVSSGKAHRRDVATGASDGQRVEISRGLKPGDAVVVEGGTALEDGMKVRTQ
jgi:RND family efflux transporter MFP subunit